METSGLLVLAFFVIIGCGGIAAGIATREGTECVWLVCFRSFSKLPRNSLCFNRTAKSREIRRKRDFRRHTQEVS